MTECRFSKGAFILPNEKRAISFLEIRKEVFDLFGEQHLYSGLFREF